ncbi:5HT2A protein, partial [Amia calva]|nr:5HT2A protein [Amia calva]
MNFSEVSRNSSNLTALSFAPLNLDHRLPKSEGLLGKANTSHACNRSMGTENLSELSCTEGLAQQCFSSVSPMDKNWPALLTIIVIILTIAGNILVILAVSLEKKLQNATNYFLMSLAIADMLLGFLVMPVSMLTILYGISMPVPVFGLQDPSKVFKDGSCFLTDDKFVLVGSFVAFFIPLTIMVVTYFLTIHALQNEATMCLDELVPKTRWTSFSFLQQSSLSSEKLFRRSLSRETGLYGRRSMQSISNEQKASKVLGIVFFLFVVMWCPFFITNVLAVICKDTCDPDIIGGLLNVFVWIGYLSSAVNPLVYTLFNKTYRSAFSRYIHCQYKEEKKPLQLILVNTLPPLAYNSTQLQLGDMGPLKNGRRMGGKDYSLVAIGINNFNTSKPSAGQANEKVSCV